MENITALIMAAGTDDRMKSKKSKLAQELYDSLNDIENISKDDITLTHINNYVHPYNSFTNIKTSILESGEITIEINYLYTLDQIEKIDNEVDKIISNLNKS